MRTNSNKKSGISSASGNAVDRTHSTSYTANRGQQHLSPDHSNDTDPTISPHAETAAQSDLNTTAKFVAPNDVAMIQSTIDMRKAHESTIHQIEAPKSPFQHPDAIDAPEEGEIAASGQVSVTRDSSSGFYERR